MRNVTCQALVDLYADSRFVFMTGDLGFMALEPLQKAMGHDFVNAGVAEQNMVSVAAGIASGGLQCWVYSIAPFLYARPFEQIRNDVCLHDFDVKLVGNGGGYAYGSMGSTHHALEDYGALLTLQNMRIFVPAFSEDVTVLVKKMGSWRGPVYLRLGRCEKPKDFCLPNYAPWRRLLSGDGDVLIVTGPLVGGFVEIMGQMDSTHRPELWVLSELPILPSDVPVELIQAIIAKQQVCVVEEHVAQGGVGQMFAHFILSRRLPVQRFLHFHAKGYLSGLYGSQAFHRKECGIDAQGVLEAIRQPHE